MSRIFVGLDFEASDTPEMFFHELERLLELHPRAVALLEFTSPGPNHRQIDCAILSPAGVDLIEIKNKHGVVTGTADGQWWVEDAYRKEPVSNKKGGKSENPYQQASNTADDFERGLRQILKLRGGLRVTPLVLIPTPAPTSHVHKHSRVALALGMRQLPGALRTLGKAPWAGWREQDVLAVPHLLGLQPVTVASLHGQVVSADTLNPVAGAEVFVGGREEPLVTDERGTFELWVPLGATSEIAVAGPALYEPVAHHEVCAEGRSVEIEPIKLRSKLPTALLEQMRDTIVGEMQARLNEQLARFSSSQDQLGAVVEDVVRQLQREREQARAREEELLARLSHAPKLIKLPQRAAQHAQLREAREQRSQVEQSIVALQRQRPTEEQRRVVQDGVALLVKLEATRRHALPERAETPTPLATSEHRPVPLRPISDIRTPDLEPAHVPVSPAVPSPDRARSRSWAGPVLAAVAVGGLLGAYLLNRQQAGDARAPYAGAVNTPAESAQGGASRMSPERPEAAREAEQRAKPAPTGPAPEPVSVATVDEVPGQPISSADAGLAEPVTTSISPAEQADSSADTGALPGEAVAETLTPEVEPTPTTALTKVADSSTDSDLPSEIVDAEPQSQAPANSPETLPGEPVN